MRSRITQVRRRLTIGEILRRLARLRMVPALCLNIFTTDLPNHPKHVLDEPTVAAEKI
jgi:hypothetical protein